MNATRTRILRVVECAGWAFGLVGVVWWSTFEFGVATSTAQDLERFDALRRVSVHGGTPDQSLWSPARINAWRKAIVGPAPAPLAVLRIPKIRLEVPVLPGTDDSTLDRGVGHIEGTAPPGTDGNIGIAGHRDGFFRGLKDVMPGDVVEVDTIEGRDIYRVERTWVVDPEDVSVLEPTSTRSLTLVTCYPFYFIGSAPSRFIIRAVRVADEPVPSASIQASSISRAQELSVEVETSHINRSEMEDVHDTLLQSIGRRRGRRMCDGRRIAGAADVDDE